MDGELQDVNKRPKNILKMAIFPIFLKIHSLKSGAKLLAFEQGWNKVWTGLYEMEHLLDELQILLLFSIQYYLAFVYNRLVERINRKNYVYRKSVGKMQIKMSYICFFLTINNLSSFWGGFFSSDI